MSAVLMGGFRVADSPDVAAAAGSASRVADVKVLGKLLYTDYIYPLEIASAILLVGMIAAIALTLRTRKDSKAINPRDQVSVKARDRMEVVKMNATQTPAAPVTNVETKA